MPTPARYALSLFVAIGTCFAGYLANRQSDPAASSVSERQVQYYTCPIHPQYKSDHAGDCPICGMRLEPASADDATSKAVTNAPNTSGTFQVSAEKQLLIGVGIDAVKRAPFSSKLRVQGRIVQIVEGLEPGEPIITSGNFLVDSESRMRLASSGPASAAKSERDPVCGMKVDPNATAAFKAQLNGETYYFCSDECKKDFEASPEKYVPEMAAQDVKGGRRSK